MGFLQSLFSPTTQTSTKDTTSQSTSNASGSSSTSATLSPEMQTLMQKLMGYSTQSMSDPSAALAPIRNAGLQGINQSFAAVPDQVMSQMAKRGYGSSGAAGDAMYGVNLQRASAASNLEGQLADKGIQQQQFGASLSQQLLNSLKGSTTTTDGSTSTSGSSNETDTKPGPSIFSSIMGLFGTLAGLGTGGGMTLGGQLLGFGNNGQGGIPGSTPPIFGGGAGWNSDPNSQGG